MTSVIISSAGTSGPAGPGWIAGTGTPSNVVGIDGSFWLDQTDPDAPTYWGPKTNGTWVGHGPYDFGGGGGGGVLGVTAGDLSIHVNNTDPTNPVIESGTLDEIAALHPAAVAWSNNAKKITSLGNGAAAQDAAAFGQTISGATGLTFTGSALIGQALQKISGTTMSFIGSDLGAWIFNVVSYGAVGDGQVITDVAMASGSAVAISASGRFVSSDVNKIVMVKNAGPNGQTTLVTTIASFQSASQVTLNAVNGSGSSLTGGLMLWATDDTAAFQAAINAATTYAQAHGGSATVFIPVSTGQFYGIGGALVTGTPTHGNAQLTLPVIITTVNKVSLTIRGAVNGSGLEHWQQLVPQCSGSTLVSFGVFSNPTNQNNSINANGNPSVIGGPSQPGGYGISPGVFSNMLLTLQDLSILTTYSLFGLTYTAVDLSGVAEANVFNFAYGTTGIVPGSDFSGPGQFANGESIGFLMPANGNNDNCLVSNVGCHGGYTWAFFATEHTVIDSMRLLYCWSAFCPTGTYFGSVGAAHAIKALQLSIEGCANQVYVVGAGSGGVGPIFDIDQLDTESGSPTFTGKDANSMSSSLGTTKLTGLYTVTGVNVTNPFGHKIINGQMAYPATVVSSTPYPLAIMDNLVLVDATAGNVVINLISAAWTPNNPTFMKIDSGVHTVTLTASGSELITTAGAAATTLVLSTQGAKAHLASARVSSLWGWYNV